MPLSPRRVKSNVLKRPNIHQGASNHIRNFPRRLYGAEAQARNMDSWDETDNKLVGLYIEGCQSILPTIFSSVKVSRSPLGRCGQKQKKRWFFFECTLYVQKD